MKIRVLFSFLPLVIVASGCGLNHVKRSSNDLQQPAQNDRKIAELNQWMSRYNQQDKAAKEAALKQAPNPGKAIQMELQAEKATYAEMVQNSHQPNFKDVPEDQRIQETHDILTKSEDAKNRMRKAHYQTPFQPNW